MQLESQFRKILTQEWLRRQKINRRYSLRAFASSLAISPSRLSEFLNGKGGISAVRAFEITDRLNLSEEDTESLRLIIQKELGSAKSLKQLAGKRLTQQKKRFHYARSITAKSIIERLSWEHLFITEILSEGPLSQNQISDRLGISHRNLTLLLQEAQQMQLVEPAADQPEFWQALDKSRWFGEDKASSAVRKLHFQMIRQIPDFCENSCHADRELSSSLLQLSAEQTQSLRQLIRLFVKKSLAEASKGKDQKKRLYGLTVQLFPIEKTKGDI